MFTGFAVSDSPSAPLISAVPSACSSPSINSRSTCEAPGSYRFCPCTACPTGTSSKSPSSICKPTGAVIEGRHTKVGRSIRLIDTSDVSPSDASVRTAPAPSVTSAPCGCVRCSGIHCPSGCIRNYNPGGGHCTGCCGDPNDAGGCMCYHC